jgi:hypothetical protein
MWCRLLLEDQEKKACSLTSLCLSVRMCVWYKCVQALWDFESCTRFRYPWAREGLAIERIGEDEGLRVVEKSTGNTLVQLTYASYR